MYLELGCYAGWQDNTEDGLNLMKIATGQLNSMRKEERVVWKNDGERS